MAAKEFSFDIVSRADTQELKNAVDQARRELANRFDFKGSVSEIELGKDGITLTSDDEFKLQQLRDILESKLIKRGVDLRHFEYGKVEPGSKLTVHQQAALKQGISQEHAKPLVKKIKDKGFKVQAQIQGDELRISGKDKDELQKTINFIKTLDLAFPLDFVNYR
ncbi:MAG TPA: YajQ family cyclic di-GMP-binding protein [Fimbriimonadales bacterium]|nr:YajQ family cyclic di-GMP-binding protein [Fimbriimonadales bacterium]